MSSTRGSLFRGISSVLISIGSGSSAPVHFVQLTHPHTRGLPLIIPAGSQPALVPERVAGVLEGCAQVGGVEDAGGAVALADGAEAGGTRASGAEDVGVASHGEPPAGADAGLQLGQLQPRIVVVAVVGDQFPDHLPFLCECFSLIFHFLSQTRLVGEKLPSLIQFELELFHFLNNFMKKL